MHHLLGVTNHLSIVSISILIAVGGALVGFLLGLLVVFRASSIRSRFLIGASIFESAIDCIFMFTSQGKLIEFNPAAEGIFGYTRKEALKRTLFDFLFPIDQDGQDAVLLYQLLNQKADSIVSKRFEIMAYRSDRSKFPAEIILTDIVYRGKKIYTAYLRDLTEIRKSEELIHQLAYFDHLTGLPNRNQFNELFGRTLSRAQQNHETLGVMFLDIYRFKWINDSFGHLIGDHTLQRFAALISSCLPGNGSVSRLGGDEFVILLPQGNHLSITEQAQNIIALLEIPFYMEIGDIYVSTNIGISMYPYDGDTQELLLQNADQAMYAAKEQGRNNYQFFQQGMQMKFSKRIV